MESRKRKRRVILEEKLKRKYYSSTCYKLVKLDKYVGFKISVNTSCNQLDLNQIYEIYSTIGVENVYFAINYYNHYMNTRNDEITLFWYYLNNYQLKNIFKISF